MCSGAAHPTEKEDNTMLVVNVSGSLRSVDLVNPCQVDPPAAQKPSMQQLVEEELSLLESQRKNVEAAAAALGQAVSKFEAFHNEMFSSHRSAIAELSLEIARRILMFKVDKGDYDIMSIVEEALSNAPARDEAVVYLNPSDMEHASEVKSNLLTGLKLLSDSNLAKGECRIETSRGTVQSKLEENLRRISEALGLEIKN